MEIIDLPHDLFLLIIARLSTRTIVLCQRVSKGWKAAFTDQGLSLQLLKDRFPRCREMRIAYAAACDDDIVASAAVRSSPPDEIHDPIDGANGIPSNRNEMHGQDWTSTFALVASRYHHLRTATPSSVSTIRLGTAGPDKFRFHGVSTWDYWLRLDDKIAPFHYPDPSWCYAQEEGLLVYHVHRDDVEDSPRNYIYPWRLMDLDTGKATEIAFPHDDERIVRRVRIAEGVLVFEWCERMAYLQNERPPLLQNGSFHRHYVTAFDIVCMSENPTSRNTKGWETMQRAEWMAPNLIGLPVNDTHRFLSTHTATRYAMFVWKPVSWSVHGPGESVLHGNEDDPVEFVIVWDISSSMEPPRIIRYMTSRILQFYGVHQRERPRLRCLGMDERNLYFVEEEHRWAQGRNARLWTPRGHLVKTTGVPLIAAPVEVRGSHEHDAEGSPEFLEGLEKDKEQSQIVHGPPWLDNCGANGDVNLSFCSRLDKPPYFYFTGVSCSSGSPGIWNGSLPSTSALTFNQEVRAAIHASPIRWPGWAPCWRHEEFPYLTVSEMVDFKAGVRVAARHCFMLETLSVHARPSLSVKGLGMLSAASSLEPASLIQKNGAGPASKEQKANFEHEKSKAGVSDKGRGDGERFVGSGEDEAAADDEVQFADEMWDRLLGKGYICGDERWLIGEDKEGSITIVRF